MTPDEHTRKLAKIDAMMGKNLSGDELMEFLDLVQEVEDYESVAFPISEPTPEEAAAFRAEQMKD
jgi:hypothetical protein